MPVVAVVSAVVSHHDEGVAFRQGVIHALDVTHCAVHVFKVLLAHPAKIVAAVGIHLAHVQEEEIRFLLLDIRNGFIRNLGIAVFVVVDVHQRAVVQRTGAAHVTQFLPGVEHGALLLILVQLVKQAGNGLGQEGERIGGDTVKNRFHAVE